MMGRFALLLAGSIAAVASVETAHAQSQAAGEAVLARACIDKKGKEISQAAIGEALLIETGVSPADFLERATMPAPIPGQTLQAAYGEALVARLRDLVRSDTAPVSAGLRSALRGGVLNVEQLLNHRSDNVAVEGKSEDIFLFVEPVPAWKIICTSGEARPPLIETLEKRGPPPRFALRETPEELWLGGKEGRKAGSFKLGYVRSRSPTAEGTHKTDSTFSIAGTAGYRLTPDASSGRDVYLFATYALKRDRSKPAPELPDGEKQSDGDTNALAVGVDSKLELNAGRLPFDVNVQAASVFDFANDASRIRLKAIATPGYDQDIGLCRIGSFSAGPLRRRCEIAGEIEAAHLLKRGTSPLGDHDTFLAVGGRASVALFLPTKDDDSGLLASIGYRFLPVIRGAPRDIERLMAELKHRFWTSAGAGIDVGFTYSKGTNELSFEEEDILSLGLGIIF